VGSSVVGFVLYEMDRSAKILGACWITAGIAYYLVLTVVSKKPIEMEI
jgi:hypothetical protein